MDVIASKQDRSALIFDPRSMTLFFQARSRKAGGKPSEWISVQARVPRTSDARDELERLERKHTAFLSAKGSVPNGYNPIRYCAMRRRYCMDHGLVKTVFELLVVVAGPVPDRKKIKTIGKGRVGLHLHACRGSGGSRGASHAVAIHAGAHGQGGRSPATDGR